jgi:hypothetical protein
LAADAAIEIKPYCDDLQLRPLISINVRRCGRPDLKLRFLTADNTGVMCPMFNRLPDDADQNRSMGSLAPRDEEECNP